MHPALYLVVYALAVARATRLVTSDRVTQAPRQAVLRATWGRAWAQLGQSPTQEQIAAVPKPLLAYLIECPWCVSIYTGAVGALVAALAHGNPWTLYPALALAFSHVTGLLAKLDK